MKYGSKKEILFHNIENLCAGNTMLAFSGGADSALLLSLLAEAAGRLGTRLTAVTFDTFMHPAGDVRISSELCAGLGVRHAVLELDELREAGISENPPDRCYLCKKTLFSKLKEYAAAEGVSVLIDGTNIDDTKTYRPGLRALSELGIVSPLKDAGFTKEDVRRLAAERGISVAGRPSSPCLATRFPYGTRLDRESLRRVEAGEEYLRSLGLYNVRLRVHGDLCRIETDRADLGRVLEGSDDIISHLKELGYLFVTLDLEGFRSGSFDMARRDGETVPAARENHD